MPESATMMEVYQLYRLFAVNFKFILKFTGLESLAGKKFMTQLAAVGQAYCEENGLPFPLAQNQMPANLNGPLERVILGPKATQAFRKLARIFQQTSVIHL